MNNVGSKTLFNPVFISIASTWAFLRVYWAMRSSLFESVIFWNWVEFLWCQCILRYDTFCVCWCYVLRRIWCLTLKSNTTNIIFTLVHNTNTHKEYPTHKFSSVWVFTRSSSACVPDNWVQLILPWIKKKMISYSSNFALYMNRSEILTTYFLNKWNGNIFFIFSFERTFRLYIILFYHFFSYLAYFCK
jgi:hypothetical protein